MQILSSLFGAVLTVFIAYALGAFALRRRPAPFEITLAIGAILESLLVFILLLANAATRGAFATLALIAAAAAWKAGRPRISAPKASATMACAAVIFAAYGVWYFVNGLAPEITPDGITYHLGLAREYARLGGFPDHITFYDMVPQGMEMLYTVAYSFGQHAAAKLVEFAMFLAGLPLMFRLGRRLGLSGPAALVPPVFYFCAPVIGLTGASSYNDAAGVFFLLATIFLLLEDRPLPAGLCAGFCYAIKMPGILVAVCAVAWMLVRRRGKSAGTGRAGAAASLSNAARIETGGSAATAAGRVNTTGAERAEGGRPEFAQRFRFATVVAIGAALAIAPWMIRAGALTGNPLAPLANRVFPNAYFHAATESELAATLRSFEGVRPGQIPWELAFGDRLHGSYGPLLLALPLGLLALRRRTGRMLWLAAAVLALPWLANSGARFLMPSLVLASFALALVLPRPAAWAAVAVQAVLCWPHVLDAIQTRYSFRLHEFPLQAALGIEPAAEYCARHLNEYNVARMIERSTPPDARTLALLSVATAYLDREVAVSWQSAETDSLLDTLRQAALYARTPSFKWKSTWPETDVTALRFRIPTNYDGEWDISDVGIFAGDSPVFNSPQWTFRGTPNRWEAPLAFDGNLATRWHTWEPVREDMRLEVDFGHVQRLTAAVLWSHTPAFGVRLEVYGRDRRGAWRLLSRDAQAIPRAPQDLRLDATWALRRAGYRYLLVETGAGGNTPIGNVMAGHEAEWGMERAGEAGRFYLLHVR